MIKRIITINILLFVGIVSFVYFLVLDDYGIEYNNERTKKGIPIIPTNWITNRSYKFASQTWHPKKEMIKEAKNYHSEKRINCNFGRVKSETDIFIVKEGSITLLMTYLYNNKEEPWLITYFQKESGRSDIRKKISYEEALKILSKNKLFSKSDF